jgi:hypothetical protein
LGWEESYDPSSYPRKEPGTHLLSSADYYVFLTSKRKSNVPDSFVQLAISTIEEDKNSEKLETELLCNAEKLSLRCASTSREPFLKSVSQDSSRVSCGLSLLLRSKDFVSCTDYRDFLFKTVFFLAYSGGTRFG